MIQKQLFLMRSRKWFFVMWSQKHFFPQFTLVRLRPNFTKEFYPRTTTNTSLTSITKSTTVIGV
jgi:hypothetical protein